MDLFVVSEILPGLPNVPSAADVQALAEAHQAQLVEDWAPAWGRLPPTIQLVASERDVPALAPLLVYLLNADQAGVLGYHTVSPSGRIYSPVFWGPIRDNGGAIRTGTLSLAVTGSHETLELATNPLVDLWCDRPNGTDEEPQEACDRVEDDTYDKNGVSLSNFLLPPAFADGVPGPFDFLGRLQSRGDMTPGGYVSLRTGGPNGSYSQQFGDMMPDWKRALKAAPHAGSRLARRLEGLTRASMPPHSEAQ